MSSKPLEEVLDMAASKEERAQILQMVSDGKISAEEGARLLSAIASHDRPEGTARTSEALRGRWLRVQVFSMATGRPKVNFSLPMGLVSVGLKLGAQFVPELVDVEDEIMATVEEGTLGKILEVEDPEDGERVEIFIE
jgi:hypothetical protein